MFNTFFVRSCLLAKCAIFYAHRPAPLHISNEKIQQYGAGDEPICSESAAPKNFSRQTNKPTVFKHPSLIQELHILTTATL